MLDHMPPLPRISRRSTIRRAIAARLGAFAATMLICFSVASSVGQASCGRHVIAEGHAAAAHRAAVYGAVHVQRGQNPSDTASARGSAERTRGGPHRNGFPCDGPSCGGLPIGPAQGLPAPVPASAPQQWAVLVSGSAPPTTSTSWAVVTSDAEARPAFSPAIHRPPRI